MDTTTIDVTDIPDAALDDEVVLLGRQGGEEITLGEIVRRAGFTLSNCQLAFKTGRRTPKQYVNYPERGAWRPLLRQAAQRSPALARALESGARWTLGEYAQRLADFPAGTPLQDPQDLPRAAAEVLAPALGPDAAPGSRRRAAGLRADGQPPRRGLLRAVRAGQRALPRGPAAPGAWRSGRCRCWPAGPFRWTTPPTARACSSSTRWTASIPCACPCSPTGSTTASWACFPRSPASRWKGRWSAFRANHTPCACPGRCALRCAASCGTSTAMRRRSPCPPTRTRPAASTCA